MGQFIITHRDKRPTVPYFPTLIIPTRVAINILLAFVNNVTEGRIGRSMLASNTAKTGTTLNY